MAAVTQPLKKRKLYECLPNVTETPLIPPPTISSGEILRRQRNKDEIRNLYECYKKIRCCISKKDAQSVEDLEQSYLSLITASRGCASVQRIVADLISKYASYCPTALEAAAKVVIDMYNRSLSTILRGEDVDGTAFDTAKSCVTGFINICYTASAEASTSTVIRGISFAVFLNVLNFFLSSFDGKCILQIIDKKMAIRLSSSEHFYVILLKILEDNEPALLKLSKVLACSLLRVFFCSPKNVLGACFELASSNLIEVVNKGCWFFSQLTSEVDFHDGKLIVGLESCTTKLSSDGTDGGNTSLISNENGASPDVLPSTRKWCLLGLVLSKDLSVGTWMRLRLKKLSQSASAGIVLKTTSVLEEIVDLFAPPIEGEGIQFDGDEECSDVPMPLVPRDAATGESSRFFSSTSYLRPHGLAVTFGNEISTSSEGISNGSKLIGSENGEKMQRHPLNGISISPLPGKPSEYRMDSIVDRTRLVDMDKTPSTRSIVHRVSYESSLRDGNDAFTSSIHNLSARHVSDRVGDLGTSGSEILHASKQLWLGSLGPGVSEDMLKLQVERFGPVEQLFFSHAKAFALVKYRQVIDAVKAYTFLKDHSPWGSPLVAKFLDPGLRTNISLDGAAVGSTCHAYVGNLSDLQKREILHELKEVILKVPRMVNDLINERALLLEFNSPEDVAVAIARLRCHHLENSSLRSSQSRGLAPSMKHYVGKHENMSSGTRESPDVQSPNKGFAESCRTNHMSQLSSFVSSLSLRYNIRQSLNLYNSQPSREARAPSNTLCVDLPHNYHVVVSDDDMFTLCNLAVGDVGSITRLSRANSNVGLSWSVECSSVQAAIAALNNLNNCPGMFLNINFSQKSHQMAEFIQVHEAAGRKFVGCDAVGSLQSGKPVMQPLPFVQPVYASSNLWDMGVSNRHRHMNPLTSVVPNNFHGNVPAPFKPASITPLSEVPQMFPEVVVPPPLICPPPLRHEMHPPLPPSRPPPPPPLPPSQPHVHPSPSSPPSQYATELSKSGKLEKCQQYKWSGSLCKSGVQYCTIYAYSIHSDICMYSNAPSEPVGWPAKLDMTKRTDVRRVLTTFGDTPPHKREVCLLVPCSNGDHKGFQDFISYLKQRECAGVIKIPAAKPLWARLLFILSYSPDTCSLLSIDPNPRGCLIALLLPKESNSG